MHRVLGNSFRLACAIIFLPIASTAGTGSNSSDPQARPAVLRPGGDSVTLDMNWIVQKGLGGCNGSESTLAARTSAVGARIVFGIPPNVTSANVYGFATANSTALARIGNLSKVVDLGSASDTARTDKCNLLFGIKFGPNDVSESHFLIITHQGTNQSDPTSSVNASLTIDQVVLGSEPSDFNGTTSSTFNPFLPGEGVSNPTSVSASTSTSTSASTPSTSSDVVTAKLPSGSIAAVAVASSFGLLFISLMLIICRRLQRRRKLSSDCEQGQKTVEPYTTLDFGMTQILRMIREKIDGLLEERRQGPVEKAEPRRRALIGRRARMFYHQDGGPAAQEEVVVQVPPPYAQVERPRV